MTLLKSILCSALCALSGASAAAAAMLPAGCVAAAPRAAMPVRADERLFPGSQLQVRAHGTPSVLVSAGRRFLIYELHLHNFGGEPVAVSAIEVRDAGGAAIALADAASLQTVIRRVGGDSEFGDGRLAGGQAAVAYLCLAFDKQAPRQLRHRIVVDGAAVDGAALDVGLAPPQVLGRPLSGSDWNPRNGPHAGSHHRMGMLVFDGQPSVARRFAIDWRKSRAGAPFAGDARQVRSYFAYGETVLAVADGVVVSARDGYPDNIPKTDAGFETAVPVTLDSIPGNAVVIDIGGGRFASYAHLQPGSVQVKSGQRVRRGQPLGRIGNSGDSRWPHLHFQLTDTPAILAGEGLPFVFERFRMRAAGSDTWRSHTREFPWGDGATVDFGRD